MARRLIGAVVLLVALAGCGGDPKADPPPTPSPSTTPVSTTPSAPAMPDAAKENSKAGAIAFVRHYVELINYAQRTGSLDTLQSAESSSCRSCLRARAAVAKIYDGGGHLAGGDWTARIGSAARRPDLKAWSVFAFVRYGPQTIYTQSETKTLNGGSSVITFVVRHDATGWSVLQWSRGS